MPGGLLLTHVPDGWVSWSEGARTCPGGLCLGMCVMGWKIMSEEWVQYPRSHPQAIKDKLVKALGFFSLTILQKGKYLPGLMNQKKISQWRGTLLT